MKVIGLTGGIACGKSTVSDMFRNMDINVIDADKISRSALDMNTDAYNEVKIEFGQEVFLPSGHINRKRLGDIIFNDPRKRKRLNEIVHPKVYNAIERKIQSLELDGHKFVVVDVPLLFETKMQGIADFTICITVNTETQVERLMARDDITLELVAKKIASQMPLKEKESLSDEIINNSKSVLETKKQLVEILKKRDILL